MYGIDICELVDKLDVSMQRADMVSAVNSEFSGVDPRWVDLIIDVHTGVLADSFMLGLFEHCQIDSGYDLFVEKFANMTVQYFNANEIREDVYKFHGDTFYKPSSGNDAYVYQGETYAPVTSEEEARAAVENAAMPIAIHYEGEYYVFEGNHRVNTAITLGMDRDMLIINGDGIAFKTELYKKIYLIRAGDFYTCPIKEEISTKRNLEIERQSLIDSLDAFQFVNAEHAAVMQAIAEVDAKLLELQSNIFAATRNTGGVILGEED